MTPDALCITGIFIAAAYIAVRKCKLNDMEFVFIALYLTLLLTYATSKSLYARQTPSARHKHEHEPFDQPSDSDSSSTPAASSFPAEGTIDKNDINSPSAWRGLSTSFNVLFEMPEKVKRKIIPELEKIAGSFRGEDVGDRSGGGGEGGSSSVKYVNVNGNNMILFPDEIQEQEKASKSFRQIPTPAFDLARKKYAKIDHVLCKLKRADSRLYELVIRMDWLKNWSEEDANARSRVSFLV